MHGYNVQVGEWVGQDQFVPRYNVAPRSQAPVIRRRDRGEGSSSSSGPSSSQPGPSSRPSEHEHEQTVPSANLKAEDSDHPSPDKAPLLVTMQTMRWGLVPHFSKHEDPSLKTINARCEALIEEPRGMWASIKGKKRCAVVCQGYYEWLKKGKERLPHFTKRADGRLMLLAGLWDRVILEGSTEPLWTFTIVTTDANKEFSWLHDRQPVILPDEAALSVWLDTSSGTWTQELSKLCAPYHASDHPLVCYAVPKEVGKIGTESPTFIEPITERKDGIQAMFAKQTRKDAKTNSPAKSNPRKRSASPATEKTDVKREAQPAKKVKVEKLNAWEDDSDIEYVDDPGHGGSADDSKDDKASSASKGASQKSSRHAPSKKATEKPSKASPRKGKAATRPASPPAKITSFFSKK
ncbi:DUF159-domain-containing protein [Lentinus tigrinus ALCF2SS1-7]|uniref:DUF159-domain-containing protein n=1 Tax=Lentinus tigrinus ALCF2SS1-7 TaxID=1328758 RepID=UPI001165F073|nr:DUF159-domain-containing protein [Lentinus tigrinus ALCF2SS1-7]